MLPLYRKGEQLDGSTTFYSFFYSLLFSLLLVLLVVMKLGSQNLITLRIQN